MGGLFEIPAVFFIDEHYRVAWEKGERTWFHRMTLTAASDFLNLKKGHSVGQSERFDNPYRPAESVDLELLWVVRD
jgi:hypothetical protein